MVNKPLTEQDLIPDSGLPDNFRGVITGAIFETNPEYMSGGKLLLHLVIESAKYDFPVDLWCSLGGDDSSKKSYRGWKPINGGTAVVSSVDADNQVTFNSGSRAGELIERMQEVIGKGDRNVGRQMFLKRGHRMVEAAFYIGFDFDWKREEKETMSGEKRDVLMPVRFYGEVKQTAQKPPVAPPTGTVPPTPPAANDDLDNLIIAIASGKTPMELKSEAMGIPEVKANKPYIGAIISGKHLTELEAAKKINLDPATGKYI